MVTNTRRLCGSSPTGLTWTPSTLRDRRTDRAPSRVALGLDQDDLVVTFIGRHWIKGAKVIEQALAALPSFGRRVVLLSAGEPRPKHRVLAHNCEVWNLGLLPPDELCKMYGVADVGVVPSVSEEGFSMASLEMMACSLPVIASRVGGIPEHINDGITGWLIDVPNAVDSWVDALVSLLTDAELRSKLGEAATAAVLGRFTAELAQENWIACSTSSHPNSGGLRSSRRTATGPPGRCSTTLTSRSRDGIRQVSCADSHSMNGVNTPSRIRRLPTARPYHDTR